MKDQQKTRRESAGFNLMGCDCDSQQGFEFTQLNSLLSWIFLKCKKSRIDQHQMQLEDTMKVTVKISVSESSRFDLTGHDA